jgi:hypothetical protein
MKDDAALKKKLRYWQNRIALTKAAMVFLKKHPAVASHTINWSLSKKPALQFEEKAFIRTMNEKGTVEVFSPEGAEPPTIARAFKKFVRQYA